MHIDDIPRLTELHAQLKVWQDARDRAANGTFKSASFVVTAAAHGVKGLDERPQNAESRMAVSREAAVAFIDDRIEECKTKLLSDFGIGM